MKRLSLSGAALLAVVIAGTLPAQSAPASGSAPSAARHDPAATRTPNSSRSGAAPATAARRPAPFSSWSATAAEARDSLVALARAQLGTRYVFGGTSPDRGFDCSGLIRYVAQALRLDVPRTADQQSKVGVAVAKDPARLRPGDLLTFGNGKKVDHIGIYVGDGRYIHASTKAGRVIESRLDRPRYPGVKPWTGVRRIVADADSAGTNGDG